MFAALALTAGMTMALLLASLNRDEEVCQACARMREHAAPAACPSRVQTKYFFALIALARSGPVIPR